jgi:hypothetical protein
MPLIVPVACPRNIEEEVENDMNDIQRYINHSDFVDLYAH